MSDFKKPSEVVLSIVEAGEVIQELSPSESLVNQWQENTYRGSQILELEPQRWNVPGWIPSDSLTVVYAAPGVGKSFYALSLAIECARGGEWVGTKLEPVPVLYVAAERLTTLRDRAEAWSVRSEDLLPSNLLLPDFETPPQLTNGNHIEALCQYIEAEKVRFVVLDTYAMMTQGIDENSSQGTGEIMGALSRIRKATHGGSVMVVHHSGKDSSRGLRGSTALLAAVDMSIEIASGGDGQISATVRKSNAGAEPMPEWYRIETVPLSPLDGESRSSAVLIGSGAPSLGGNTEKVILEMFTTTYYGLSASKKELLQDLEEQGHKLSESGLRRYLASMVKTGKLTQEGNSSRTRYRLSE